MLENAFKCIFPKKGNKMTKNGNKMAKNVRKLHIIAKFQKLLNMMKK